MQQKIDLLMNIQARRSQFYGCGTVLMCSIKHDNSDNEKFALDMHFRRKLKWKWKTTRLYFNLRNKSCYNQTQKLRSSLISTISFKLNRPWIKKIHIISKIFLNLYVLHSVSTQEHVPHRCSSCFFLWLYSAVMWDPLCMLWTCLITIG